MATEITDGVTVVEPWMVLGWEQTNAVRTVVHDVLASQYPDVTLRPAASRSGTLELLCADEASAVDVETLHVGAAVLTLTVDAIDHASFPYVVTGPVTRRLDAATRRRWVVSVPYREVVP